MKFLLVILLLFATNKSLQSQDIFDAQSFNLKNGLKVVVVENHRAPVVAHMIWYNFGSGVEEKGKSGLAHFMEHLMFKGTKKFKSDYFSNYISKIGGSENAFTSYDYTAYYQVVPSDKIEKIIEMEADRMTNLTLIKSNVGTERKVILEERFQRIESDPSSLLNESMRSVLFPNHYYGRPIIGWKHEIENLLDSDVRAFYKKYYKPNNATVILSGDITLKKAKKLTKRYYGKIKKSKIHLDKKVSDPELRTSVFVELKNPNVKQPIWKKIYRVKSYNQSIKDGIALDIGLKILAGGSTSLLYENLVKKEKVFSMMGAYFQGFSKGDGYVYFYAIPNKKLEIKKIDELIYKNIKSSVENDLSMKRFEIEKKKYLFDSIYRMDGILKPAEIIGEAISAEISLEEIENWNENLVELTLNDVQKALKDFMENKNYVLGGLDH